MKKKVLKNPLKRYIKGWFRGREVAIGPRHSQSFNMDDEEERALYYYWKETYSLRDITANVEVGEKKIYDI